MNHFLKIFVFKKIFFNIISFTFLLIFTGCVPALTSKVPTGNSPEISSVTAGNGQAAINFQAPTSINGSAVSYFTVTASPGLITTNGTASPIIISGLTNGVPYTFTVTATNFAGNELISQASQAITPNNISDSISPIITSFLIPATSSTLNIAITNFTAADAVGVTAYCLTEVVSRTGCVWTTTPPLTHLFNSAGIKSLYAWARDAAGNVSLSTNANITIVLPDAIIPTITQFLLPAVANTLTVPVTLFLATDNVAIDSYCLTEVNLSAGCSWSTAIPSTFDFLTVGAKTLYAWVRDTSGNVSLSTSASVIIDMTPPLVTAFTTAATSSSLTVTISSFFATDLVAIAGYCITETASPPTNNCTWTTIAPTSYTFTLPGTKTLYAWAIDTAGNISLSSSATTLVDTALPTISAFTISATSTSLIVAINSLVASDNIAIANYCLTETTSSVGCIWGAKPAGYTFTIQGTKPLYAWAKDTSGNISLSAATSVIIDTAVPTISSFTIPATSTSLTITLSTFTAADNNAVTSYCLIEAVVSTTCNWVAILPTQFTFNSAGAHTLYAWVKDAVGNISLSSSAPTTITLPDITPPLITAFSVAATSTVLTVPIVFTATDNVAVATYCVQESSFIASCTWAGVPANFPFATVGSKTLYAWVKDSAGNVSSGVSSSVLVDNIAPSISNFILPALFNSLTVPITNLTVVDNIAVNTYCLTTTNASTGCVWTTIKPTSYLFSTTGVNPLYVWAKDTVGNISSSRTASVNIDTTAPLISAFTIPATSSSLTVAISTFTASDTGGTGVSSYCLTETITSTSCVWGSVANTSFHFATAGTKTLYAWAQDAAGNISISSTASTTITLTDTIAPTITAFLLPTTSTAFTVTISSFTATDDTAVTSYCVLETSSLAACTWGAAPTSHTFTMAGPQNLYAWAMDAAGNISTMATSSVNILTYQWTTQLGSGLTKNTGIASDSLGNIFIGGTTNVVLDGVARIGTSDFYITKYNSTATKLWTRQLGVSTKTTLGNGITVDSGDNVLIIGYTDGDLDGNILTGTTDAFVSKYDNSGVKQWTRQIGVVGNGTYAYGVATDSANNIYITGYTSGGLDGQVLTGTIDSFITKYDATGVKQWTKLLGTPGAATYSRAITVDSGNNIIITGDTFGGLGLNILNGTSDVFLAQYTQAGGLSWTQQLGVPGAATSGLGIITDPSNAIYITGFTSGGLDGQLLTGTIDSFLTKYSTAGVKDWTKQTGITGASLNYTYGIGLTVDNSGFIYSTGYTYGNLNGNTLTGTTDMFTTKYDNTGVKLFSWQLGAAGSGTYGYSTTKDLAGDVYVSGYTYGGLNGNTINGVTNAFVTKLLLPTP